VIFNVIARFSGVSRPLHQAIPGPNLPTGGFTGAVPGIHGTYDDRG